MTFFEVSFQETKVLVLPAKKASNSRRWCYFFCLWQSLLFKKEFSPEKGKQRENGCFLFSFYLFSSISLFFFWREKKKVYRKNEEKQRYTQKTCLVVEHVPLFIQQTHEEKKTFFLRLGIENKEKKNSAVSKKQRLILKHKKVGKNT